MYVGKTSPSILKAEVFRKFSEAQVLCTVFPEIKEIPCVLHSPLRSDTNPSFSIYIDSNNHIRYKDHGCSDAQGGLLDLLCAYWQCSFLQALERVSTLMGSVHSPTIRHSLTGPLSHRVHGSSSNVQVTVRPWRSYDYDYWASYGVSPKWLHYAEVYPISHKIIVKNNPSTGKCSRYIFPADKYAYCFVERKDGQVQLKIYQPYNTKGFKWCSKMNASVIGLWTKIPKQGSRVIICSSLKDALVVACQLRIPTLCLQGEGYGMSSTAVSELKKRFNKIFICFDTDEAGIADGKKLSASTGFINVIPDFGKEKDFSDYYKALKDKTKFKQLKSLFN